MVSLFKEQEIGVTAYTGSQNLAFKIFTHYEYEIVLGYRSLPLCLLSSAIDVGFHDGLWVFLLTFSVACKSHTRNQK